MPITSESGARRAQMHQERSRVRRDAMMTAALDLLVDGGTRAVTHRAIAEVTGFPLTTTAYYFGSTEELIRESLTARVDAWTTEITDLLDHPSMQEPELEDAAHLLSLAFGGDSAANAFTTLRHFVSACADDQVRPKVAAMIAEGERVVGELLRRAGVFEHAKVAEVMMLQLGGRNLRISSGYTTSEQEVAALMRTAVLLVQAIQHEA